MRRLAPILLVALLLAAAMLRDAADRWVARTEMPAILAETSVEMRDRNGRLLRVYTVEGGRWRLDPRGAGVDPGFIDMLVRYEDKRFWHHAGVDPRAMLRAAGQALWHGRTVSGGSTLTMQVARLLENSGTGSWPGKLRQIRLALALERRLTKAQILQLYLTHAPYGGNLAGVRAATLAWFGKEPARLTPAQSALLVALPQRPAQRRPDRAPEQAKAARDRVLHRMQTQSVLSEDAVHAALTEPLPRRLRAFPQYAAHETDHARARAPNLARHHLTLDVDVQRAFEALAQDAARRIGQRVSVALLAMDHRTGAVLAAVGSPGFDDRAGRQGYVDMTRAVRSPGSTLKPLIYGLAFDQGLAHPETVIHDGPITYDGYSPQNFDGAFRGDLRVRAALQQSLNTPVVQLTHALGPSRVMAALRRAGAAPVVPGGRAGLAVALGGVGLSLRDLVQLYGALAQGGQSAALHVTSEQPAPRRRVLSPEAAWHVGDILQGLAPPPGASAGRLAYKTGTSYGHRDAWAIGYDGAHVVGVWIGRADGTPVPGAFGGDLAAPLLFDAFGRLAPETTPLPAPPPATLILGSAELPQPLRRFRPRDAAFSAPSDAPQVIFPPEGARLAVDGDTVFLKLRGGVKPFAVLADGKPLAAGVRAREIAVPHPGAGFSTLVVVDAQGRSDRVTVRLD